MSAGVASPEWPARVAAALDGNAGRIFEPVLDVLRRSGRVPRAGLRPAAVLAAIVDGPAGPGVLLTRRRGDLAHHGGQVAFPGGERDASDSDSEHTALREAEEEVGLARQHVRVLGRLPRYPTVTGYLVTPVVGYVADLPELVPQPSEVAHIFVLPLAVLLDADRWQDRPLEFGGERLPHRELHWEGERIWGATAGMLRLLLPALRAAWETAS